MKMKFPGVYKNRHDRERVFLYSINVPALGEGHVEVAWKDDATGNRYYMPLEEVKSNWTFVREVEKERPFEEGEWRF